MIVDDVEKWEEKKQKRTDNANKRAVAKLSKIKKVNRKIVSSSSSSRDGELSMSESDDSLIDFEDELEELLPVNTGNLKKGTYKYMCVVDNVDDSDGDCRVIALRCADKSKKIFSLADSDISDVPFEDIIGLAPDTNIILKGARM
ncbi:unnamed protein product [Psylliodes chrysocephalus]|uniref:Uncharacterized protein n=1 Tax=Psylliodes chrysocephalus TaxID=3402493 RepID=A0A9P0C8A0_9CUCU|nr:unnamed protein product [Psylliodes chrysocephala]